MDPQQLKTTETFDRYNITYSESVDKAVAFTGLKTDFFTRVKADYLIEAASSHFKGTSSLDVLDVGCGVGNYHFQLTPHFHSLTGVDVSPACVETAKSRNPTVNYVVYSGGRLPFPDNSFDLVFTICVMHHVPPAHWQEFASEMYRVLKVGGLALTFEHNPRNSLTIRAVNNCPFDEDAVLLRSETTKELFSNTGFRNISIHYILTVPPFNRIFRRIDVFLSSLRFGAQYFVKCLK